MNKFESGCPKCHSEVVEFEVKSSGAKGYRCSANKWDAKTQTATGCDWYIIGWEYVPAKSCPKCGAACVSKQTLNGKMVRCSLAKWDDLNKVWTICDYKENYKE